MPAIDTSRPLRVAVAGFVGAPPMNFLKGSLERADGKLWLVNPSFKVEITGEFARSAPMKEVILGIRPHLMRLSEAGSSALPVTVYAIEQLGNEAIVICDGPAGEKVRVIAPAGFTAPIGTQLHATFDGAAARLFDPATERVVAAEKSV